MPTVFVSYVHEDAAVAFSVREFIATTLKLRDVFLSSDKAQVFAGDNWLAKIKDAVRTADVVVLMLSARSVKCPWVNFEAGAAWVTDRAIIPCCYAKQSKHKLPHPYSGLQALDLKTEADYLLESVCHHLHMPSPQWEDSFNDPFHNVLTALERFQDIPSPAGPADKPRRAGVLPRRAT